MPKWLLLCCSLMLSIGLPAQENYVPPFDFPLTFSGNFGEIRANHFHGGLDFKTGGTTGKTIHASGKGYISRIRVTQGSGYVLDVCYDNGHTAIYRHLNSFLSPVAERVRELQYAEERWDVEIIPSPEEYPVESGQPIGLSGNTGYSFGPHLHLDFIENATGDYIDPMPFFATHVKDTRAPQALGFALFPRLGEGVVQGSPEPYYFAVSGHKPLQAWGVIGAGIRAYDYMDGVHNHYGVRSVVLQVDGTEVFRSTVDRFSEVENRMINSWTSGQYMKSFIEPGNSLRMLEASNGHRGWVTIDEERDYVFTYILSDVFGNTSRYSFTLRGKRQPVPVADRDSEYWLEWDKTNHLQKPGMLLLVPKGALYDNALLCFDMQSDSAALAYTYRLHRETLPLHTFAELHIALRHRPVADSTKYYVACITPKGGQYSVGGSYKEGWMTTRIRQLGTYTVAVDTVAPQVTAVFSASWGKQKKIRFRASDKGSGIGTFGGTIDGEYAPFWRPNSMQPYWECVLDPQHVARGKKHTVEFTVTDACGNTTVCRTQFSW